MPSSTLSIRALVVSLIAAFVSTAVAQPRLEQVGRIYDFWSSLNSIAVQDHHLFASTGKGGLRIVDFTDADQPVPMGCYEEEPSWGKCSVSGDLAVVLQQNHDAQISLFDISDPSDPRFMTNLLNLGHDWPWHIVTDIELLGNRLYVLSEAWEIDVFDLSDVMEPQLIGCYATSVDDRFRTYFSIYDNFVYIAGIDSAVRIIDFTDPANPIEHERLRLHFQNLCAGNGHLYVELSGNLAIYSLQNPAEPLLFDTIANLRLPSRGNPVGGGFVVCERDSHLVIFDTSSPEDFHVHAIIESECTGWFWQVSSRELYLPTGSHQVTSYDLTDLTAPMERGSYPDPGVITSVSTTGSLAAAGMESGTVKLVDFTEPESPVEVGEFELPYTVTGVAFHDGYLIVFADSIGAFIYDVTDPARPQMVSTIDELPFENWTLSNGYLYVVRQMSLIVYDLRAPDQPEIVTTMELGLFCNCIEASEDRLVITGSRDHQHYVASYYSLEQPAQPQRYNVVAMPNSVEAVAIQGDIGYLVTNSDRGPSTVYSTNLATGQLNDSLSLGDSSPIANLTVHHNTLVVGGLYNGVELVEFDGNNLLEVSSYHPNWYFRDCVSSGDILVASTETSLQFFDVSDTLSVTPVQPPIPESVSLHAFPNPFNTTTEISFDLPSMGFVKLSAVDLTGREIAVINSGWFAGGSHRVVWQADYTPSGLYLVKLQTPSSRVTRKVMLIR